MSAPAASAPSPALAASVEEVTSDPGKVARARSGIPVLFPLDGLRWLAVFGVVAQHMWGLGHFQAFAHTPLRNVLSSGVLAFDLLFIISGFVMFLPAAARGGRLGSTRGYALRRAARLLPAYYLSLAFILVLFAVIRPGLPSPIPTYGILPFLTHLPILQTESQLFPGALEHAPMGFGANGALWTLSVEVLFYVTLPFVAAAFHRRPLVGLGIALVVSAAYRVGAQSLAEAWFGLVGDPAGHREAHLIKYQFTLQFPAYLNDFAIGMAAALAFVRLRDHPRRESIARAALAVEVAAVLVLLALAPGIGATSRGLRDFHRSPVLETLIPLLLGAVILASVLARPRTQWLLGNRLFVRLADVSYGVYLYHLPIVSILVLSLGVSVAPTDGAFLKLFALVLAGALLAGWLSFVAVERPVRIRAQSLARRIGRRDDPRGDLAAAQAQG